MDLITILGNLAVLGIVAIVLALFRRADKNSKSLEQINRYATKRSEEFDKYVEEKIVELKDLSVGLEVQEKTGVVILNKIAGEVDSLSDKIKHIEELNKKVISYNSTMDKMLALSKELDNRYTVLKKDALYMESLDKRVKEGSRKLLSVEKGIKDITAEFIKSNNNSIQKLKEVMLSTTSNEIKALDKNLSDSTESISQLNHKLDSINKNFENSSEEKLSLFKEKLDNLVDGHRDNVNKIIQDSKRDEESAFNTIKDSIKSRTVSLSKLLDEEVEKVEASNSEKLEKLSSDMSTVESIAKKIQSENSDRLESIKEQLDKQLLMLKEANFNGVNTLQEEFSSKFSEFEKYSAEQIERAKDESRALIDEVKEQYNKIEEQRDEAKDKIVETEDYIVREYRDLKDRVEGSIFEITRDLNSQEEKVKDEAIKYLENNIHLFKDEVDNKLEELTGVTAKIDQFKKETAEFYEKRVDELLSGINNKLADFSGITDQVDIIKGEVTSKLDTTFDRLEEELKEVQARQDEYNRSFDQLKGKISLGDEEIKAEIESHNSKLKDELFNKAAASLETFRDKFQEKMNSFDSFEDEIERTKEELKGIINSKHTHITDNYTEFHNLLTDKMENEREKLIKFVYTFNSEKLELEDQINQLKESSYSNISEKLNAFEDEYFSKLRDKEEYIDSETEKWKGKIDSAVNEIKEESLANIQNSLEDVNIQVNEFKENSQKIISEIEDVLRESQRDLISENESFKVEVNDDVRILRDELSTLQSDVTEHSSSLKDTLNSIEREQERFIKESDIFSRADILRDELKEAIEQLSNNLNTVKSESDFVSVIKTEIEELRGITSKVNTQIESLNNKQAVVDSLESRVEKVLMLSDSVDEKLSRIKESDNKIGEVQLKLRTLKELESEVIEDLNRLENKQGILDETNKAIDSGFGHIQIIENKLDALKENLIPFNNQIDNVKDKLHKVEERESRIDKAIDFLSNLDNSVKDLEEKIEKMDKAREWIAGVETRLNESVRTANEQVKLMGALAQDKGDKKVTNSPGAPNMNMRDMVIKLAHNNWKAEDIARTTKLSLGEVELILELSPRK